MPNGNTVQIVFSSDGTRTVITDSQQIEKVIRSLGPAGQDAGKGIALGMSHGRSSIRLLDSDLGNLLMKFTMVKFAVESAFNTIAAPAKVSVDYLSQIETATLGIASSYMTGGRYVDALTGKVLQGQQALNAAQVDSADAVGRLQYMNLQTIATLDQIIRAYQEALPVAQARGFSRPQIEEFTTAMIQAAGAIDASGQLMHMLGEETRSLLTGAIEPRNSRIAMALGIRPEDVKAHMGSADQLFAFLMGKLDAYRVAGSESQKTLAGLVSNTKDIMGQAGGQAFQPLFEALKYELMAITSHLVTIDETTKQIHWNPEFISDVRSVRSGVNSIIAEFYRMSMLIDLAGGSMTAFGSRTLKVAEIVTRFMTIGQFGDSLKGGSEKLAQWNRELEQRYQTSEKALQALADREAGIEQGKQAKLDTIYRQNAAQADEKQLEKERKARDRAEKNSRDISLIMLTARERDLMIGKEKDEKELLQLDLRHQKEIKRLQDLHASTAQIEEASRLHKKERDDVAANQTLEKARSLALSEVKITEDNYRAQAEWLDKLDQLKLKKGEISESDALDNRYQREREILRLQTDRVTLQYFQAKTVEEEGEALAEIDRLQLRISGSIADQNAKMQERIRNEQLLLMAHHQRMADIEASGEIGRLQFIGDDQGALDLQRQSRMQAISAQFEQEFLQYQGNLDKQKEASFRYHEEQLQAEQEFSLKQAQLWWDNSQKYIGFAQQMSTMAVQMLLFEEGQKGQIGKRMLATTVRFLAQELQLFMFNKAKENILSAAGAAGRVATDTAAATANLTILQAQAQAWAGFFGAMALNPFGGQLFIPAATAMSAVAGVLVPISIGEVAAVGAAGVAGSLGMAALWAAGGIAVGALGEGIASSIEGGTSGSRTPAGYGAGSPASPVITQNQPATPAAPVVHVTVYALDGQYTDWDGLTRDKIYPAVKKAVGDGAH